jgi:xanthine/CO dehydrogenase XdhC/CoxF family maturation factor
MSELGAILRAARARRAAGDPFLFATVVRVRGSAYRHPGARMVVAADDPEPLAGSISGGCLERDVAQKGFWRTRKERAVVVTYDRSALEEEDAFAGGGLGCDGIVDVLVERPDPADPCDPVELLAPCVEEERPVAVATVLRSNRADLLVGARLALAHDDAIRSNIASRTLQAPLVRAAEHARLHRITTAWTSADRQVEVLIEVLEPPPHLFVFGTGLDAVPVVTLAKALGWTVTVCDHQGHFATQERFAAADRRLVLPPDAVRATVDRAARPAAVVLSHDVAFDRAVLGALLPSRARYVGVLGPRRRTDRILDDLGAAPESRARLHAPIGLDLAAETPAEVALAILAEAQSVLAGTSATPLRLCHESHHAEAPQVVSAAE